MEENSLIEGNLCSVQRIVVIEMKESEEQIKKREEKERLIKIHNQEIYQKYVTENIKTLEEWSGHQMNRVLYDSDKDGKDSSIFREKIINHEHLYFIVFDSNDNVFGHYHDGVIDRISKDEEDGDSFYDPHIFIFTLNSNGRCGVQKFDSNYATSFTCIQNDYGFYNIGNDKKGGCYYFSQIDTNESCICEDNLNNSFKGITKNILVGESDCDEIIIRKIVVLEMK